MGSSSVPMFTSTTAKFDIADVDVASIAQALNSTFGIEPVQVIDVGEFKAIALPPNIDINSLGPFARLFKDPTPNDN